MPSVNDLLREALENLGYVGEMPTSTIGVRVRRQLVRTLRVRIPQFVNSHLRKGSNKLTIADTANPISGDATGIYDWPADAHSLHLPLILVNAAGTDVHPRWYSSSDDFWRGLGFDDLSKGTPGRVLVRGKTVQFRPILDDTAGPWKLTLYGNIYPPAPTDDNDVSAITLDLEDAVVAGATLFTALLEGDDEIVQRFTPLWEATLRNLQTTSGATHRAAPNRADF